MDIPSIAALLGANKQNRIGVSSFLRDNLLANPGQIEALADEVAKCSNPRERNNKLSSLRVLLDHVSTDLDLPKHTVVKRGDRYRVELAKSHGLPPPYDPSIYTPLRLAAERASERDKDVMLKIVLNILGRSGEP